MPFSKKKQISHRIPKATNYTIYGNITPNMEFYLVYSTSACDYQNWQCQLLEESIKNSKDSHRCQIIKLITYDSNHKSDQFLLSEDVTFVFPESHDVLDNGEFYAPLNKPYTFKYLTEYWFNQHQLDKNAVFVLVDPDMVWYQPINTSLFPSQGTVIGHHWMDNNVMFPLIIRVSDLYKIRNQYLAYTNQLYPHDKHPYITEQYAFTKSLLDHHIKEVSLDNLGPFVTSSVDTSKSIFLHYCQPFLYKGDTIWFKQNYTGDTLQIPWKKPYNWKRVSEEEKAYRYVLQLLEQYISKQETANYRKPKTISKK